jgi:hypothetical protein
MQESLQGRKGCLPPFPGPMTSPDSPHWLSPPHPPTPARRFETVRIGCSPSSLAHPRLRVFSRSPPQTTVLAQKPLLKQTPT